MGVSPYHICYEVDDIEASFAERKVYASIKDKSF